MLDDRFRQLLEDSGQICVMKCGWYDGNTVIPNIPTARQLLLSNIPDATRPKACLQNVLAKLAAPAGDPRWDSGWDPKWQEECTELVKSRVITEEQGGFLVCAKGASAHEQVKPQTNGRLLESVSRIVCVTR